MARVGSALRTYLARRWRRLVTVEPFDSRRTEPCCPGSCVPMPGTVGKPRCIYCRHPIEEDEPC